MGLAGLVPEGSRGETSSLPISASGGCQHSSVHDPFLKSLQPLASRVPSPSSSHLLLSCDITRPEMIQNNFPTSRSLPSYTNNNPFHHVG